VPLCHIHVGDHLRVRPGEAVPIDGVIIEGKSAVDESMVTGESMPVMKEKDAAVIGGTMNQTGGFVMKAERVGGDTMLSRIVQMVAEAQRSRAPIQRLADHVSAWFVPAVMLVAIGICRMGCIRPVSGFKLRVNRGGQRSDHRMPLRPWSGHADVDYGWRGARRTGGRPDQECRSLGAYGKDRHAGRR
jgi:magnesium-transporting ATPase (P-type)